MAKMTKQGRSIDFIFFGVNKQFQTALGERVLGIQRQRDIPFALSQSTRDSVWILGDPDWTSHILATAIDRGERGRLGDVLFLSPLATPQMSVVPLLRSSFHRVAGDVPEFKVLALDQLADVFQSKNREDRFIGGIVDESTKSVTLLRGSFDSIVVPFSLIKANAISAPDFSHFDLGEYGVSLRFGDYEISSHAVLFAVDPNYRRRVNKQRIEADVGFGPSLRRLRTLKGLSRDSFPGITPKTIARIERKETDKPHGATLQTISKALGVKPEEIESY